MALRPIDPCNCRLPPPLPRERLGRLLLPGVLEWTQVLVSIAPKLDRPRWLRAPAPSGENYRDLKALIDRLRLHTVCESAACPNVGE